MRLILLTAMLLCTPITQAENARDSFAWIFNQCEAQLAPNAVAVTQCATDLGLQAAQKRGETLCSFYGDSGCMLFLSLEGVAAMATRHLGTTTGEELAKLSTTDYRDFRRLAGNMASNVANMERSGQRAGGYPQQAQPRRQYNWNAISELGRQFQQQYNQSLPKPPRMITCSTTGGFTNCQY